jgi:hypothetical protein
MIYPIKEKCPEFIGPVYNLCYVRKGQVRPHKYNDHFYVYETLPAWTNPNDPKDYHEAEDCWIRFDLAYFKPQDIRNGVAMDDPSFTEDSLLCLKAPLSQDEINALIDELNLKYNAKPRSDVKTA